MFCFMECTNKNYGEKKTQLAVTMITAKGTWLRCLKKLDMNE